MLLFLTRAKIQVNKKLIVVSGSHAARITSLITDCEAWHMFEVVIVRDDEFDHACAQIRKNLPINKEMVALTFPKKET